MEDGGRRAEVFEGEAKRTEIELRVNFDGNRYLSNLYIDMQVIFSL